MSYRPSHIRTELIAKGYIKPGEATFDPRRTPAARKALRFLELALLRSRFQRAH